MDHPPSIDSLAHLMADIPLPRPLLVDAARAAVARGDPASARQEAMAVAAALLRPVINATGVLLHTNLGRSPIATTRDLCPDVYSNLELDVATGARGSRQRRIANLIARATGGEDALVVNNGAAAVLLALSALASDREVVVSRGELIEIGGGFRIPEVLASSGARLIEVGTTNRTRLADYAGAIGANTALLLKVHQSNYRIVGFTEATTVRALCRLDRPVVVDLGSGLLDEICPWLPSGPPAWLKGEPGVRQTLAAGADLVTFSGDKLLGGPQAGLIVGSAELVARCGTHPLARALRPGGLILAALQATLLAYLSKDAASIPFWEMATRSVEDLQARADAMRVGETTDLSSMVGGGSLPGAEIPSCGVRIRGDLADSLRAAPRPVIARVQKGDTLIDLRTVDPTDDLYLRNTIESCR
jgi:L-seryl-tRNA(Ser) seleniumtransferase